MDSKQIKILIVDDNVDIREIYAEVFRKAGFNVIEANDGMEGLDMAVKEIPEVIFTGIIMPRMDGFAMMESLKENEATSKIPVVISSHMGREEDREKAKKMGAKDFIFRGETSPNQAVNKIRALFANENYDIEFNRNNLDAAKLARNLNMDSDFRCKKCGADIILRIKMSDPKEDFLKARLICPKCGWTPEA